MIYKDSQTPKSLLDFLVQVMPDWQNQVIEFRKSPRYLVNGRAAKTLFALWRDSKNKVDNYILQRPTHVSLAEVSAMQEAGLVRDLGEKIEITSKGKDVIKTMILGDDKSIYEEDGNIISFETAYANTKRRTKTARKVAGGMSDAYHYALRLQLKQCEWDDVPDDMIEPVRQMIAKVQDRDNWYKKMKHANNDNGTSVENKQ